MLGPVIFGGALARWIWIGIIGCGGKSGKLRFPCAQRKLPLVLGRHGLRQMQATGNRAMLPYVELHGYA
eukprot:3347123-Pyramimonas_sp.AAC.1